MSSGVIIVELNILAKEISIDIFSESMKKRFSNAESVSKSLPLKLITLNIRGKLTLSYG